MSIATLMQMQELAGRPQDRIDIEDQSGRERASNQGRYAVRLPLAIQSHRLVLRALHYSARLPRDMRRTSCWRPMRKKR